MLPTLALMAVLSGTVVMHHKTGAEERVPAAVVDLRAVFDGPIVTSAVTAMDGTFTMPDVAPGPYIIKVTANQGGTIGEITVSRNASNPPRTVYLLDPTCDAKYGRVTDSITGEPIAGAEVNYLGPATTNADGDYFINLGCFSGPGFRFHNSFFFGAEAEGYRRVSYFGGRAEYATGGALDFELRPILRLQGPVEQRRD